MPSDKLSFGKVTMEVVNEETISLLLEFSKVKLKITYIHDYSRKELIKFFNGHSIHAPNMMDFLKVYSEPIDAPDGADPFCFLIEVQEDGKKLKTTIRDVDDIISVEFMANTSDYAKLAKILS